MSPKYPNISVSLSDIDGNAFNIMANITKALRKNDVSDEQIEQYLAESTASDYNNLLSTASKWVNIS
jgi:hypothetical protein